jgi:hypothetical protein
VCVLTLTWRNSKKNQNFKNHPRLKNLLKKFLAFFYFFYFRPLSSPRPQGMTAGHPALTRALTAAGGKNYRLEPGFLLVLDWIASFYAIARRWGFPFVSRGDEHASKSAQAGSPDGDTKWFTSLFEASACRLANGILKDISDKVEMFVRKHGTRGAVVIIGMCCRFFFFFFFFFFAFVFFFFFFFLTIAARSSLIL